MIQIIAFISICLSIYLGYQVYKLKTEKQEIVTRNEINENYNKAIEEDIAKNTDRLENVKSLINSQHNILQSLQQSAETLRESAEERAQEVYNTRSKENEARLQEEYNLAAANYNNQLAIVLSRINEETEKLNNLEAKQLAYIQAQQRQKAIDEQQDYYRLVLNDSDLSDVELLRDMQKHFFKKEAIDKLIWEVYYKGSYDNLMAHLFDSNSKVSGIYKITDLITGQAYIGQSVDIRERFRQHIKTSLQYGNATNKLYQQMKQSGQSNFTFEVLEEVPRDKLNERETYWIDFYKTKEFGMNKTVGGS